MRKWATQVFLVLILIYLAWMASIFRLGQAIEGLAWNSKWWMCEKYEKLCPKGLDLLTANFGVYDPKNKFDNSDRVAISHYFLDWRDYDASELEIWFENSKKMNRWPMITVEPWIEKNVENKLLEDVLGGKYDLRIEELCSKIGAGSRKLFVRFAHEMERVTGRYPWAVEEYELYIGAYNHFVDLCRKNAEGAFFVWSPAGDKGLENYWPGHRNVDYVGLSIYSLPEFEGDVYGRHRTFSENLTEKYDRISGYNKPVILAEVGIDHSYPNRKRWLTEGLAELYKYELVKSVVYFNDQDKPGAWPEKYGIPDWEIDPDQLLN